MSYIDKNLLTTEKVLYRAKVHPIIFAMPVFWVLVTLVLLTQDDTVRLLAYVTTFAALYYLILALVRYYTSEYAVTNKRVLMKFGLIHRHSLELFLHKVEGIQVSQNLLGRIIRYGTVIIIGTGGTRDPFSLIAEPLTFRRKVLTQVETALQKYNRID
jgi:uncharacterized membrane protein YdbT with pleckstrin-like domain